MAGISSPGIGSGLNVDDIVTKLMTVERQPLTVLDQKEASYQAQLTAYGTVKGALSSLQSAIGALATPAKFNTLRASVGDGTIATASASASASKGSHSID